MHGYITTKLRSSHIVCPISLVHTTKFLKYWFMTPFTRSVFPTIWKWKVMINLSFIPTFLEKYIQNALVNFGYWSDSITFGNPWCLYQPLRIGYAVSTAVAVPTIGTMCANLANRATITKIVSYSCGSGKFVIKSMHIQCHDQGCLSRQPATVMTSWRVVLGWTPLSRHNRVHVGS